MLNPYFRIRGNTIFIHGAIDMNQQFIQLSILYRSITPDIFTEGGDDMSEREKDMLQNAEEILKTALGDS